MAEQIIENAAEENPEEFEEKSEEPDSFLQILSPEGLIMFFIAGILDLIGYILLFIALDDFWITDIIGTIFIGGWMLIRGFIKGFIGGPATHNLPVRKRRGRKKTGRLKRWGLSTLFESVFYLGDILPCWTLAVYYELKNNPL